MGLSIRKHPAIGVPPFMEAPILFSILRSCYRDAVTQNGSEFVQRPKVLKAIFGCKPYFLHMEPICIIYIYMYIMI